MTGFAHSGPAATQYGNHQGKGAGGSVFQHSRQSDRIVPHQCRRSGSFEVFPGLCREKSQYLFRSQF